MPKAKAAILFHAPIELAMDLNKTAEIMRRTKTSIILEALELYLKKVEGDEFKESKNL